MKKLESLLNRIDGKSYSAYKDLKGKYEFQNFKLYLLRVQGDPFASPSLLKIEINLDEYGFDKELYNKVSRKVAFEDYIGRVFNKASQKEVKGNRGTGKSGAIFIYQNGQEILKRTSVEIEGNILNIKFYVGLPAAGRRVLAKEAKVMLLKELANIVTYLEKDKINILKLDKHIMVNETADLLRKKIKELNLVVFIKNGSILPRKSGVNERALENAIPFKSPKSFEVEIELINGEKLIGMGIKKGITVITGGGFHGKSTLLNAIEKGVYNHIPGDGREYVITNYNAVKIRAEDGRGIQNVDISPFINNLPYGKDTNSFKTENASGSTSQAANIIEALEMKSDLLLIDEDTSATNFMMRDLKIQRVIKKEKEPITPFIERIRSMYDNMNISTIVVVGGLGDYFDIADNILMLDEYNVLDITEKAKIISKELVQITREKEIIDGIFKINKRKLNIKKGIRLFEKKDKVKTRDIDELLIGKSEVDLRYLEQIVEHGQTSFIGEIIKESIKNSKEDINLFDFFIKLEEELMCCNISEMLKKETGNLVFARRFEIISAINRIRDDLIYKV